MNWITPGLAAAAAAVAIPSLLILYFLKLRRRDAEVSTTLLWKKAVQDLQANAPFQKLRRNILLFLQLLVLAGVLFALAQPQLSGETVNGQRHVILIDRSASMNSLDESGERDSASTRLEGAKKQASQLIDGLKEGGLLSRDSADEAMIIAFDSTAEVRQQFTSDKQLLKAALESLTPSESPTRIEEAMRLARAHQPKRIVEGQAVEGLTAGPPMTIHIYSDGKIPDADRAKPGPEDTVEFHRIGLPTSYNVGIVNIRSERDYENPTKLSVFVSLSNSDPQVRSVDVEFAVDGVVAGIRNAQIPAASTGEELSTAGAASATAREREATDAVGTSAPTEGADAEKTKASALRPGASGVVFSLERPQGAVVQVRLRSPGTSEPIAGDVLSLDDRAFLIVPPAKKLSVAVFTKGNLFLTTALGGLPLARLVEYAPSQLDGALKDGSLVGFDVVVLDGCLPAPSEPTKPSALPPGRFLVLGGVPQNVGVFDDGEAGVASVVDWVRDHPITRTANLDGLQVAKTRKIKLKPGGGATALASLDNGPGAFEYSSAELRAVVVPFDPMESNWPFSVSYVLFVGNSVNYLGDDAAIVGGGRSLQPGGVLSAQLPMDAQDIKVKVPGGDVQKITPAADGRIVFGPLAKSGVYDVSWTGTAGPTDSLDSGRVVRPFAANLLDVDESNVASAEQVLLASREVRANASNGGAMGAMKLAPWLLLLALAIILVEWFVYNKKVQV